MASKKRPNTEIDDAMAIKQTLAVANLLGKRGIAVSGATASSLSMSVHSSPSVQSSLAKKVGVGASQSSILTSMRGSPAHCLLYLHSHPSLHPSRTWTSARPTMP